MGGRSRSARENSLSGFLNTCKKLQCFPLKHFFMLNSPAVITTINARFIYKPQL